jgi:hypothetical protein
MYFVHKDMCLRVSDSKFSRNVLELMLCLVLRYSRRVCLIIRIIIDLLSSHFLLRLKMFVTLTE